ncbi:hypothetical protein [Lentibacillus amyloliquefaciens]|uniref:DUF5659 domain-containing protein n=1 Tax=Lentibacillus amyloliquefaciens TaxID=1472767 RepID=A0A0U4FPS8_9BACI|nr:hypothetical protein [Lentibacillus amyloliquefaciens]ALX47861.1 hypothetical protein AOX59_04130 [Lentibacillus amyloliquefaciens]
MTVKNEQLFYCYSRVLSDFIYKESGIVPLTVAINPKSKNTFSLYAKSPELQKCLDAYKAQNK